MPEPEAEGPTPFIEANAILAAGEQDTVAVYRLLNLMSPGERTSLFRAADFLMEQIQLYSPPGVR